MSKGNILDIGGKNGSAPQQKNEPLTNDDLAGMVVCSADDCNSTHFILAIQFVVVSRFSPKNPTGKNALKNLPETYFCKDCGEPMDPESITKLSNQNGE